MDDLTTWSATKEPVYDIGEKVRKKVIGNGFIHGIVVDSSQHPEHKATLYTVAWENGPIQRSQEWPRQLMKEDAFNFNPENWRPTAASEGQLDGQWHTVPRFDHRDKTKYKPGDTVSTTLGAAKVINTAKTPLGQLYRVEMLTSGMVYDFLENDITGKVDSQMYYGSRAPSFPERTPA